MMLQYLYVQYTAGYKNGGETLYLANNRQQYAAGILCDFMKRKGDSYFPPLDRDVVGIELLMRVGKPGLISQGPAGVCGPAAFLYNVALDSPAMYAQYAIDLYEKGKGRIRNMDVSPSVGCRNYIPPETIAQAEWLTAGSLRDSSNAWLDFDDVSRNFSAGTNITDLVNWFKDAGYSDIRYDDNLLRRPQRGRHRLLQSVL
jgi:hypothetical protein